MIPFTLEVLLPVDQLTIAAKTIISVAQKESGLYNISTIRNGYSVIERDGMLGMDIVMSIELQWDEKGVLIIIAGQMKHTMVNPGYESRLVEASVRSFVKKIQASIP